MEIRLLGKMEVVRAGTSLPLPRSRKTRALLGYLAATREAQGRSWLCDLLWEGPADPRAALRWSLTKLRSLLDEDDRPRVLTRGDQVSLDLGSAALDLSLLERLVTPAPDEASVEELRTAAGLFRGAFLEGLQLDGCYRFDAWLSGRRETLGRLRSEILSELLRRLEARPEDALPVALERLRAEPFREAPYLDVARILEALGRTEEARTHLDRARLMVEQVLDAPPSDELQALDRRLDLVAVGTRKGAGEGEPSAAVGPRDEVAAARGALRRGRPGEAFVLLERALGRIEALSPDRRPEHRLEALELLVHPDMAFRRPADLGRRLADATEEARRLDRSDLVRSGFYLVANLHYQEEDFEGALRSTLRAARAGRVADPATTVRALADTARCLGMLERDPDRAARLAEEARTLAVAVDEPLQELEMALGLLRRHEGRYEEALEHFARGLAVIRESEDDWWESTCLLWIPMIHFERGAPADALVACGELRGAIWRRDQAPEAAFADGLEALARSDVEGRSPGAALDGAAASLRVADSRWMLAYLLVEAGSADARAARTASARARAEEALEAARSVRRQNEAARARALLADLAAERGERAEARCHLEALEEDGVELAWLSARAAKALAAVRERLGEMSAAPPSNAGANGPSVD